MQKILICLLVIIFTFFPVNYLTGPVYAETGSTSSGNSTADDAQAQDSVEQLSAALEVAKQELANKGFSFSAIKKLTEIKNKLTEAITKGSASNCDAVYDSLVKRLDNAISSLKKKSCTTSQRILSRGKCAKFLNNPVKFQQCEAQEHGHKPKKPKKPKHHMQTVEITSIEMSRGKCIKFLFNPEKFKECEKEEHGTKPPKPQTPELTSCITQETLDSIIPGLQSASESLKSLGLKDDNANGVPNFCENNAK